MINFSELIAIFFYIVLLILCIFVIVHASFQIKNTNYIFRKQPDLGKKNTKKMAKIIIVGLIMFSAIFFKVISNFSLYKADKSSINNYKYAVSDLNNALSLELLSAQDNSFRTAQDIAYFINKQLPIMMTYYLGSNYQEMNKFSKEEILKYKLSDFEDRPTVITYDGMLMSVIKFNPGCNYINNRNIEKSDCLIMVDVNHYSKPNQIGQDRTIFALDGRNHKIKPDPNFFN